MVILLKMNLPNQVQLLNKTLYISFRTNLFGKGINLFFYEL